MAVYKVPQDVEAEDKLIGPFSFRQFIYLIIVAIAGFMAYFLSQIFIGLIIIPLPIIIFFGALALPLRKDQPMETYLVAVIRFFLKPRIRLWIPDGSFSMVSITAPTVTEYQLTKNYGSDEAQQRLSYLAQIVDTKGWSSRGVLDAPTSLTDTVAAEAQSAVDVLDESAGVAQTFDTLIDRESARRKQTVSTQFKQAAMDPESTPFPPPAVPVIDETAALKQVNYNPYPSSMHQHVLQPATRSYTHRSAPVTTASTQQTFTPPATPPKEPVTPAVSPDIIRLANTNGLSISTIAREAHRIEKKDDNEVIISLR